MFLKCRCSKCSSWLTYKVFICTFDGGNFCNIICGYKIKFVLNFANSSLNRDQATVIQMGVHPAYNILSNGNWFYHLRGPTYCTMWYCYCNWHFYYLCSVCYTRRVITNVLKWMWFQCANGQNGVLKHSGFKTNYW